MKLDKGKNSFMQKQMEIYGTVTNLLVISLTDEGIKRNASRKENIRTGDIKFRVITDCKELINILGRYNNITIAT